MNFLVKGETLFEECKEDILIRQHRLAPKATDPDSDSHYWIWLTFFASLEFE